ncbi:MAG: hypothetical protein O7C59_05215, partial [Rickettsia endosymbiont of Ixodes persulcatus]|nr:hypothetical protein [Rickettsia endosymbiont of Ixodes persulcatus]
MTQNKSLLKRRGLPAAHYFVPPTLRDPLAIFQSICRHFGVEWVERDFYARCTSCNEFVRVLERAEYSRLAFLPEEYSNGVNDDGDALYVTCCLGVGCARVRWWSSRLQKETRMALAKVRLNPGGEYIVEHNDEDEIKEVGGDAAALDAVIADAENPDAAIAPIRPARVQQSEAEVIAGRLERKAQNAEQKLVRTSSKLERKELHRSKIRMWETAAELAIVTPQQTTTSAQSDGAASTVSDTSTLEAALPDVAVSMITDQGAAAPNTSFIHLINKLKAKA